MVDRETYRARALETLRENKVQEALAELVAEYWSELHDVFVTATVHNKGIRPENITNELQACLHHIARGLGVDGADPLVEIERAKNSHIKRGTLDSYKIAINSILEEDDVLLSLLDYILLADDLAGDFKDRVLDIKGIREMQSVVKEHYREAKHLEAGGNRVQAVGSYNAALDVAMSLKNSLKKLYDDPVYTSFLVREGRRRQDRLKDGEERVEERKKDRRHARKWAIVASIVTGLIVSGFHYLTSYISR